MNIKVWFFLQFPEFGFLKPSMQMAGAGDGSECQVEKMTATSTTSPGPSDLSTDTEPDKETRTHPDQTGVVLLWSNKTIEVQLRQFKFHSLTQDIKYSWESLYRKLAKFFLNNCHKVRLLQTMTYREHLTKRGRSESLLLL